MQGPEREQDTILIATDGSAAASAAVEAGLKLAAATQARVRFVHAASPLAEDLYADYPLQGPPPEEILARDSVLEAAFARAREMGAEAEVEVLAGEHTADLAAGIAGLAEGIDASMIVVGSRGRGTVAGVVLGSVSHNLLKYATIPVLVVHAPDSAREAPGQLPGRRRRSARTAHDTGRSGRAGASTSRQAR